jgi:hypothetical protein
MNTGRTCNEDVFVVLVTGDSFYQEYFLKFTSSSSKQEIRDRSDHEG